MIQLCLVLTRLSVEIICDNREFLPFFRRDAKSLTDAFPLSLQEEDEHHGHGLSVDNDLGSDTDRVSRRVNRKNRKEN